MVIRARRCGHARLDRARDRAAIDHHVAGLAVLGVSGSSANARRSPL
jgi:hypothetical protein